MKTANFNPSLPRRALLASALAVAGVTAQAAVLLSEDFEDGVLDSRLSFSSVGTFTTAPGIADIDAFGSSKAFGYGRSTCPASCFGGFVTTLTITFDTPTFVDSIAFKEIELYGNWGSGGGVFVDGSPLATSIYDFGRLPYNDLRADATYRERRFDLNRSVTTIELRVWDITRVSEIAIDDLTVGTVPEPASVLLWLAGLLGLALRPGSRRGRMRA